MTPMNKKLERMLLSGGRLFVCIVLSQVMATWLNIAGGVQFGTPAAGQGYAFSMFMGAAVGVLTSIRDWMD